MVTLMKFIMVPFIKSDLSKIKYISKKLNNIENLFQTLQIETNKAF